jgi:signal transduction histidine kinase
MELKSHRFICYFLPEQAAELCQIAEVETFTEGAVIFEENEIPDSLYLVLEGTIEFCKHTASHHYQTVAWAEPNDFFGEFGVLDGQPRSARAVARGKATLAKIDRDRLMEILERSPGQVVLKLFNHIIQYLRLTTDRYVEQIVHKQKMTLIGEMANTIIHDFKSPFTAISLASSMLTEIHAEDEDTLEWCELIQAQTARMLAMAEEVLEFTRGSSVLHKKPVNLATILQKFEKLNRIYLKESNVKFIVRAEDLVVKADENKLIRLWQNLVGNAVEALEGREGQISIIATARDKFAAIEIVDNGRGSPDAIHDRLFEPFVTYGKRGGTGLGTAIAKSIVEAHGGEIEFESQSGKGTKFLIRLPLSETTEVIAAQGTA